MFLVYHNFQIKETWIKTFTRIENSNMYPWKHWIIPSPELGYPSIHTYIKNLEFNFSILIYLSTYRSIDVN